MTARLSHTRFDGSLRQFCSVYGRREFYRKVLRTMAFRCGQKQIDDKNTLKNLKHKSTIVKCIEVYKKNVEVKKNESDQK